jgi:hypothetical protein
MEEEHGDAEGERAACCVCMEGVRGIDDIFV